MERGHLARTPRRSLGDVDWWRSLGRKGRAFPHIRRQSRLAKMSASENMIVFENVSKFYGEILGVNRVTLDIPAGITSLVGPNGAGKTTLMNLMTGLLRPTQGRLTVLGIGTDEPEKLFRKVGYCSQFDSFPRGLTGREFINSFLMVSGFPRKQADELTEKALERVELLPSGNRKI